MRKEFFSLFAFCCLGVILLTTACRNDKDDDIVVGKDQDEFSSADQAQLGAALVSELEQQISSELLQPEQHKEVFEYLNKVFATLVQTPGIEQRTNFDWEIFIVHDNDQRIAFTAPGGKVYVSTGMLNYLESEHELIGLIAHELYYTDKGIVLDALKNQFGGDVLADILLGSRSTRLGEMSLYLSRISYAKDDVNRADTFAVETLCPFMYDPRGLQSILERAETDQLDLSIEWLEHRPADIDERIRNVVRAASGCGTNGARYEERYASFKTRLP